MYALIHFLFVVVHALAAVAAATFAIRYAGATVLTAAIAGLAVFAVLNQAYAATVRLVQNRRTRGALAELTDRTASLEQAIGRTGTQLRELAERFDVETRERNDKLVSEMRVIESLIKRLAETGQALKRPDKHQAHQAGSAGGADRRPLPMSEEEIASMSDGELLDTIRHSLEDNRVDLYLQPIVTLPQRKVRFYEALTRLRAPTGEVILPRDYVRIAESAGMMSTVDNLLLFRCIQVVRKLSQRNRETGLFCNISANSLLDSDFFPQFVEYMELNKDLAGHLVFEFSQSTVDGCGPLENESLRVLASLGFKFSMDQVADLRLDYAGLNSRGFRYIKIPADTLLRGVDGADIHPGDLKELMSRFGLDLIVDRIESERAVVDVLDYDVDYGQGYLFGEPRPVRDEVYGPSADAA